MLVVIWLSLISGSLSVPINCNIGCKTSYSPVCGSDGKTYTNACELYMIGCMSSQQGLPPVVPLFSGMCNDTNIIGSLHTDCHKICDEERAPICASNGIVYENPCHYSIARCIAARNGTLKVISHTSSCPTPKKPDCSKYIIHGENTSDLAIEGPLGAPIMTRCTRPSHQVCTNYGSLDSECQLCQNLKTMEKKYRDYPGFKLPDYRILYDGPCYGSSSSSSGGFPGIPGFPFGHPHAV